MEKKTFKTNIKCMGCIEKVTPYMNELLGEANWSVDLKNPDRPLTVNSDQVSNESVVEALKKAGYKAEPLVNA